MKKSVFFLSLLLGFALIANPVFATDDENLIKCDDGTFMSPSNNAGTMGSRGPGSLTTLFASNNGYAGNMFDIVPTFDMMIEGLDINTSNVGETIQLDLFYKDGTCVGFETNAAAWTHLGTFTGVGAGQDLPTFIDTYSAPQTFLTGQTYGIYVNVANYGAITGNLRYTNLPPTNYSNADLSLDTWCGCSTPAFNSFFANRAWNGTIYYDDPHAIPPMATVKVNGSTDFQTLYDFQNVQIDYDVKAFSGAGTPADVWIICITEIGLVSYSGGTWYPGLVPYATGPLADVSITPVNQPIPWLGYFAPVCAIDDVPDGMLSLNNLLDANYVQFKIEPFIATPMTEDFNDGVADNWVDDGAHWAVPVDTYYLDTPSFARWVSYYAGSEYGDFTYTASMQQVTTPKPTQSYDYGMIFRSDGTVSNGYDFYAESDGSVYLYKRVNGSGTVLYSNTLSSFWNVGLDVWNTVSIVAKGDLIEIYINGNLEASVNDSTFGVGYIGLTGQGSGTYDQEYQYDDISVTL